MRILIITMLVTVFCGCVQQEDYMEYHSNGKLKTKGQIMNERKTGDWTSFDSLGKRTKILTFLDDTLKLQQFFKQGNVWLREEMNGKGIKHGFTTLFYENNKEQEKMFFVNGKQMGDFISYYPNGTLQSKYTDLEDGETIDFYQYYPNGQLFVYAKNMANGKVNFYDSLGNKTYDVLYENSFPIDTLKVY